MHIELKVILDLDTIVCLIRTLLYGEIEIHAIQCHREVDCDFGIITMLIIIMIMLMDKRLFQIPWRFGIFI